MKATPPDFTALRRASRQAPAGMAGLAVTKATSRAGPSDGRSDGRDVPGFALGTMRAWRPLDQELLAGCAGSARFEPLLASNQASMCALCEHQSGRERPAVVAAR